MQQEYKTQDLQLAVHLRLCGLELKKIEKSEFSKRSTFVFLGEDKEIKKIIDSFWDKSVKFATSEVLSMVSEIKRRLYQG